MEHKTVSKFYESIKSRMLVAEVIERIRAGGKGRRGNSQCFRLFRMKLTSFHSLRVTYTNCNTLRNSVNGSSAFFQFTFDYLMLLVLASMIAFMGLVENSNVVLVASMLVSPIMGPILAGIFGAVVGDTKLRNQGVRNEVISLAICILIGFLGGLCFVPWIESYGVSQWPTQVLNVRGPPGMMSASEGGGGHGKTDVVREVA